MSFKTYSEAHDALLVLKDSLGTVENGWRLKAGEIEGDFKGDFLRESERG
jgi:hypothetical protein